MATLPFAIVLANQVKEAAQGNLELRCGLNIIRGEVVYKAVADTFSLPYSDVKKSFNPAKNNSSHPL